MSSYRLTAYGYGYAAPLVLSVVFDDVAAACTAAETIIDRLEDRPHLQPYRVDVTDVWTRETVTRVHRRHADDPDPFAGDSDGEPGPNPSQMRVALPGPGEPC